MDGWTEWLFGCLAVFIVILRDVYNVTLYIKNGRKEKGSLMIDE